MVQDQEKLNEIGSALVDGAQSVLPMLLPKPVEAVIENIVDWQPQAFPEPMVLVTTNFTEGPTGSAYLLLVTKNASTIVDLMLGGEGVSDRSMNEEAVDAIKEVMNQILGVMASGLRDKYSSQFALEQVEVHSLEAEMDLGLLLDDGATTMIEIKLSIEGLDPMNIRGCFPESTVLSIFESAGANGDTVPPSPSLQDAADEVVKEAEESAGEIEPMVADQEDLTEGEPPDLVTQTAAAIPTTGSANIDLILELELPVVIRLGSTEMNLKEIMKLGPGATIELSKGVDEPVELLVNDQVVARGEVVVVDGNFAFRVTDIESKAQRIKSLT